MITAISLMTTAVSAQSEGFSTKEWPADAEKPFVFYISGDGGFNGFSTGLCNTINNSGYAVTALNAKSYFWKKKTAGQSAEDIAAYLEKQFSKRKNQQLVLAGYSFGADVLPFIVNNLPDVIKKKLLSVIFLAPSPSTDFEIHWSDMLGGYTQRNMDVVAEINKMDVQKAVIITGVDDIEFPIKDITLKYHSHENLPGGHRFEGNTTEVVNTMIKYFK
ncbi:MAG TPA: AcvB/VirJ family lysyl-phosphatidylglycerol hydrolase [Agriterribacter sp.]|nr:AcvB/VirJ family lysyl-phosphatidylglycerol hydrolase [Agriterribacter sp.]